MNNINESYISSLISKQDALTKLITLKCRELSLILDEPGSAAEKLKNLSGVNSSVNDSLKLILEEEKCISEQLKRLLGASDSFVVPKPQFENDDIKSRFEAWNPEIETPKEITYNRVYEIPKSPD